MLSPPGRFLQKKEYGGIEHWVEIEDNAAIERVRYYFFRNGKGKAKGKGMNNSDAEISSTEYPSLATPSNCVAPEREVVFETTDTASEIGEEETFDMSAALEREEVTKTLSCMVSVLESLTNEESLSVHVDEEWITAEKQMQALLKQAFKQVGVMDDSTRWKSLQEHSIQMNTSFISEPTFTTWWNDFDHRICRLPKGCIKVMGSFCLQQHMTSFYTQDVAILAPPGKLGIVLVTNDAACTLPDVANAVGKLRVSCVIANQICPGDGIVAIDDEDVSQMDMGQVLSIMARKIDDDKVLVIRPSLTSTMNFIKPQLSPPTFQSPLDIMIFTQVKAYITANRLRYNEVRVLLQLPPSLFCKKAGGKLSELYGKNGPIFDTAWTVVIPKIAHWWASVIDSKRQRSFDVSSLTKDAIPNFPGSSSSNIANTVGLKKVLEISDCLTTYITSSQFEHSDVLDLLHLRPSSVVNMIGAEICELRNGMGSNYFGIAFSQAKKHVLYWYMSTSMSALGEIDRMKLDSEQSMDENVYSDLTVKPTTGGNDPANDDEPTIAKVIETAALPDSEKGQRRCLNLIQKHISSDEVTSLNSHNALAKAVINSMRAHPNRGTVHGEGFFTLSKLVWSLPAVGKHIVNKECGLPLAMHVMSIHAANWKAQEMTFDFLVSLSYDEACCNAILESDVISSVLESINRCLKYSKPKAAASGLLFLRNMAAYSLDSVAKKILGDENIIPTLLRTIYCKNSSVNLLSSVLAFMSNLAFHPDGRSRIVDVGGAVIIQDKLASIKKVELLHVALETLLNLALDTTVAKLLAETGCADEVIAHSGISRDKPDLLLVSLCLLDKLIETEADAKNELLAGAESMALAAISAHTDNKQLRSVAISVLQKVSE